MTVKRLQQRKKETFRLMYEICAFHKKNIPRCGFSGATSSLLPVFSGRTGEQVASGTQTSSVIIESTSCSSVSTALPLTRSRSASAALSPACGGEGKGEGALSEAECH